MNQRKEQVYAGLGHLFYSIAASDGRVSPEESAQLKKLVRNQWMPVEAGQDEAGTDLAYYIEIGFDHANDAGLGADKAFERFKEVHAGQAGLFDASTRNMVLRTAQAVADAFGNRSQHERRILEQLKEVLQ
ncbi:MAG: TerB family tellurite resistance protein [Flavobacteriales bacterium]|nr:TerB family tellurite resistance protein [Flavobacteriales bacterium]MBP9080228.1 TerB family tellurite resistance protein [Flavobacteriales bacterium]